MSLCSQKLGLVRLESANFYGSSPIAKFEFPKAIRRDSVRECGDRSTFSDFR
jgi:hypothetical protein